LSLRVSGRRGPQGPRRSSIDGTASLPLAGQRLIALALTLSRPVSGWKLSTKIQLQRPGSVAERGCGPTPPAHRCGRRAWSASVSTPHHLRSLHDQGVGVVSGPPTLVDAIQEGGWDQNRVGQTCQAVVVVQSGSAGSSELPLQRHPCGPAGALVPRRLTKLQNPLLFGWKTRSSWSAYARKSQAIRPKLRQSPTWLPERRSPST